MRNELELSEQIERYLKGQLSATERAAFEEQISKDPQLREDVALQQEVMKGIERAALKQKIQHARLRFRRVRNFTRWGLGGLAVIALMAVLLYFNGKAHNHQSAYVGRDLPEYNESNEKNWADADRNIAAQVYWVDAASDTVIETKGGIVLLVSANGFLDHDGQPVKGKVQLVVKEALSPAAIISAGLSSQSGDKLLESGGMFFVDARKDGKILRIDPSNGIYAEIPSDTIKPGMQLFSGKRLPGGGIDWVNPRPLEHALVPVDILSLDFYPPYYLDSLHKWGYDAGNKVFTDSLYFSFAALFQASPSSPATSEAVNARGKSDYKAPPANTGVEPAYEENKSDSAIQPRDYRAVKDTSVLCGINPAKIKTIWSKEFQNTLLATREFEQRIHWIHRSADSHILDLYVNNLDKNLSYIDSMAARQLSGGMKEQFLSFAARQDGKVKNGVRQFDKLKEYYQRKAKAFTEAISKTQNEFWNKQAELDKLAGTKRLTHEVDSSGRISQNFQEEFSLNLKEAYRQLGYDTASAPRTANRDVYTVRVTNTGWCNVDRYVEESVLNRTSLGYTDPKNGRKATIKYLPVSFQVEGSNEYDRLYVYLLPDKLNSYMLVTGASGKYQEKLDELMKYKLVCIGYKGERAFVYSQEDIRSGDYPGIVLVEIGKKELDLKLDQMGNGGQAAAMRKEDSFFRFEIGEQKRQRLVHGMLELRQRVMYYFVFPCYMGR